MPYHKRVKSLDDDDSGQQLPQHVPHRSSRLVEWPVLALVFVTPLAVGTAHLWSVTLMLALALLSFAALVLRRRARPRSFLLFPMGAALLGACLLTAWQLLPLPPELVGVISPGAGKVFDYVLAGTPLGDGSWQPLNLDPPAGSQELAKYLAYLLVFVVVVNYFNERHRARRLLKALAWSGFAVVVAGFANRLLSLEGVFGIYPAKSNSFFVATFINPNHMAGFLSLAAPVGLGLALSARERQARALYAFLSIVSGAGVFLSLSRGGMVAFSAGLALLLFHLATRRTRRLEKLGMMQAAAVGVLLIAGYLSYDTIMRELRTLGDVEALREETKLRSWEGTLPMMAEHPLFGIGRGAYATVYPRFKTVESQATFTHAENEPLQLLVEWGPLFGLLFCAAAVATFMLALFRARLSLSMIGVLAAVFTVGAQNLVDFNLEIGGVAMPFAMLLGILAASPFSHAGRPGKHELRFRLPGRLAVVLALAAAAAGLAGVVYAARHQLRDDTERLLAAAAEPAREPCREGELGQASCAMLKHHPADYLAPLVLGRAWLENSTPRRLDRAAHWLSRALFLYPANATAHRLLGRTLFLAGFRSQSLVEYRLAAHYDPRLLTAATTEVLRLTGSAAAAIQATPPTGNNYLAVARNLRALGKKKAAERAARLALEQDSTLLPALDLLADLALERGRLEEVAGLARRELELDPLHERAYLLQGQVLIKQGDAAGAEKVWLQGLQQVPESSSLAYRLVDRYLGQGRLAEAEAVAARLQSFAPSRDSAQARLNALLGRIHEAKGMLYEARRDYLLAAQLAADVPFYLFNVGRMEERMGNWDEAERIYRQLLRQRFQPQRMKKLLQRVAEGRRRSTDDAIREVWMKQDREDRREENRKPARP